MSLLLKLRAMGPPTKAQPPLRVLNSTRFTFETTGLVCEVTRKSSGVTILRYQVCSRDGEEENNVDVERFFSDLSFKLVLSMFRLIDTSLKASATASAAASDGEKMGIFFRELDRVSPPHWPKCAYEPEVPAPAPALLVEPCRETRYYKNNLAVMSLLLFDVLTLGSKFCERELVKAHGDYLVASVAYHYLRPEKSHDRSSRYVDAVDTNPIAFYEGSKERWSSLLKLFYEFYAVGSNAPRPCHLVQKHLIKEYVRSVYLQLPPVEDGAPWRYRREERRPAHHMTDERVRRLVVAHGQDLPVEICQIVSSTNTMMISDYPFLLREAEKALECRYVDADLELRRSDPAYVLHACLSIERTAMHLQKLCAAAVGSLEGIALESLHEIPTATEGVAVAMPEPELCDMDVELAQPVADLQSSVVANGTPSEHEDDDDDDKKFFWEIRFFYETYIPAKHEGQIGAVDIQLCDAFWEDRLARRVSVFDDPPLEMPAWFASRISYSDLLPEHIVVLPEVLAGRRTSRDARLWTEMFHNRIHRRQAWPNRPNNVAQLNRGERNLREIVTRWRSLYLFVNSDTHFKRLPGLLDFWAKHRAWSSGQLRRRPPPPGWLKEYDCSQVAFPRRPTASFAQSQPPPNTSERKNVPG